MASISQQIRDAVPIMEARAAQFDDAGLLSVDELVECDGPHALVRRLLTRAVTNADRARDNLREMGMPESGHPEYLQEFRDDVADFMNLGALVLSVLPPADVREAQRQAQEHGEPE